MADQNPFLDIATGKDKAGPSGENPFMDIATGKDKPAPVQKRLPAPPAPPPSITPAWAKPARAAQDLLQPPAPAVSPKSFREQIAPPPLPPWIPAPKPAKPTKAFSAKGLLSQEAIKKANEAMAGPSAIAYHLKEAPDFTLAALTDAAKMHSNIVPLKSPGLRYKGQPYIPIADALTTLAKINGRSTTDIARWFPGAPIQDVEKEQERRDAATGARRAGKRPSQIASEFLGDVASLRSLRQGVGELIRRNPMLGGDPSGKIQNPGLNYMAGAVDGALQMMSPQSQLEFADKLTDPKSLGPIGVAKDMVEGAWEGVKTTFSRDASAEERGKALMAIIPPLAILLHGIPKAAGLMKAGDPGAAVELATKDMHLDAHLAAAMRDHLPQVEAAFKKAEPRVNAGEKPGAKRPQPAPTGEPAVSAQKPVEKPTKTASAPEKPHTIKTPPEQTRGRFFALADKLGLPKHEGVDKEVYYTFARNVLGRDVKSLSSLSPQDWGKMNAAASALLKEHGEGVFKPEPQPASDLVKGMEQMVERKKAAAPEPPKTESFPEGNKVTDGEGNVFYELRVPTSKIQVRPGLQYKESQIQNRATGETGSLSGVKVYDEGTGPPLTVWESSDGSMYAMNGHNRLGLAKRTGHESLPVKVYREADGITEDDARVLGALQNLRDGEGTAIDAVAVLKKHGFTVDDLKEKGVALKKDVARNTIGMMNLPDDAIAMVKNGQVNEAVAGAIGDAGLNPVRASAVMKEAAKAGIETRRGAEWLADKLRNQQMVERSDSGDLFGDVVHEFAYGEQAKIVDRVMSKLAGDERLYKAILKGKAVGDTVIDAQAQTQAAAVQEFARKAMDTDPEFNRVLESEAIKYAEQPNSKNFNAVVERVHQAAQEASRRKLESLGVKSAKEGAPGEPRVAARPGAGEGPAIEKPASPPVQPAVAKRTAADAMADFHRLIEEAKRSGSAGLNFGEKGSKYIEAGGYLIEAGLRAFGEWAAEMFKAIRSDPQFKDATDDEVHEGVRELWAKVQENSNADKNRAADAGARGEGNEDASVQSKQEQSAGAVDVRAGKAGEAGAGRGAGESAGNQEEVQKPAGAREAKAEGQGSAWIDFGDEELQSQGKEGGKSLEATGLANQVQEAQVARGALEGLPEKTSIWTREQSQEYGERILKGQGDPLGYSEALAAKIKGEERPFNKKEAGILLAGDRRFAKAINEARAALNYQKVTELESRRKAFLDDVQKAKGEWHNTGVAMQAGAELDTGNYAEVIQAAIDKGQGTLSPKIKKQLDDLVEAHNKAISDLNEMRKRLADMEVRRRTATASRQERVGNIRERRAAIKDNIASILKESDFYAAHDIMHVLGIGVKAAAKLSVEVGKLVGTYIEEGVTKLPDIVDRLRGDLPEGLSDTDIHDLISGYGIPRERAKPTPLQEQLRRVKAEAKKLSEEADPEAKPRAEQKARDRKLANLQNEQADLEHQLASGKFKDASSRARRVWDKKVETAQRRVDALKSRIKAKIAQAEPMTAGRRLQGWARMSALSSINAFANLGLAVGGKVVITPLEEAIGPAVRGTVGKLGGLAKKAGSELRFSPRAEFEAARQIGVGQTWRDIGRKLIGDEGSIKSKAVAEGLAEAYPDTRNWILKIEQGTHGAIKTVTERNAFAREYVKAMSEFKKAGADTADPSVRLDAFMRGYAKSQEALLLNDTAQSNLLRRILNSPKSDVGRGALKSIVPIARIPVNLAGQSLEFMFGTPYAFVRHMWEWSHGTMTEESAQAIARAYKRGGVGAAMIYWGANSSLFDTDDKGHLIIAGHKMPAAVSHIPWVEPVVMGIYYRKAKGGLSGAMSAVIRASRDVATHTPFLDVPRDIVGAFGEYYDTGATAEQKFKKATGELVRGMAIPQILQQIAALGDKDESGDPITRKRGGFFDELKYGIPGLRQTLDVTADQALSKSTRDAMTEAGLTYRGPRIVEGEDPDRFADYAKKQAERTDAAISRVVESDRYKNEKSKLARKLMILKAKGRAEAFMRQTAEGQRRRLLPQRIHGETIAKQRSE